MSLYQKYRPKDFDSLVGQDFTKIALSNALAKDKLVGGYLFYGSRGTGKTTVARILARWVNCLDLKPNGNPCNACANCLAFLDGSLMDVVEIDAASNTGVDNIRDLIERAQFQPTQAKYKVYIIDEVHMLSKGAFNALLKTLEEPPAHVKFILATTELQKIPETIISRTQRFDFKKIDESDIVRRLAFIAEAEGIRAEEEALKLIAKLARGGMRDAITLFEQYAIGGELTYEMIASNLQLVGDVFLENFLHALIAQDVAQVLKDLDYLKEQGVDIKIFIEQSCYFLRDKLIASVGAHVFAKYLAIFDCFHEIYGRLRSAPNAFMLFEISMLAFVQGVEKSDGVPEQKAANVAPVSAASIQKPIKSHPEATPKKVPAPEAPKFAPESVAEIEDVFAAEVASAPSSSLEWSRFDFNTLVANIKNTTGKSFVSMSLKSSSFKIEGDTLIITPNNDFNRGKISTPETIGFLGDELQKLVWSGAKVVVR